MRKILRRKACSDPLGLAGCGHTYEESVLKADQLRFCAFGFHESVRLDVPVVQAGLLQYLHHTYAFPAHSFRYCIISSTVVQYFHKVFVLTLDAMVTAAGTTDV